MRTYKAGKVTDAASQREFQAIQSAAQRADPFAELIYLHAEPDKVRGGMLALADGADWNPGSGAGLYRRSEDNTAWVFIG